MIWSSPRLAISLLLFVVIAVASGQGAANIPRSSPQTKEGSFLSAVGNSGASSGDHLDDMGDLKDTLTHPNAKARPTHHRLHPKSGGSNSGAFSGDQVSDMGSIRETLDRSKNQEE